MNKKRWMRFATAGMAFALVGAACGASEDDAATSAEDTTATSSADSETGSRGYESAYTQVREAYHHMYETADVLAGAIAKQKGFAEEKNAASDTRQTLNRLLGEHALLASVATTKALGGAPDTGAAVAALDENSADLGDVIGSVYGDEAKNEFLKQWRDHIRMFVDYTKGLASGDKAAQDTAVAELGGYVKNFGTFLGTATGLPPAAVQDALKAHVGQLKEALDNAKAGKADAAYAKVREAYGHMGETAAVLAGGIAKQKNLGDADTQAAKTRATLGSLLGEHAALAALATTKGLDAAPDFNAVASALDENSAELGDVIGSVYGDAAKNEFLKQWRDHIRMFVDYTTATAKQDKGGQDKAVAELNGYVTNFGKFLGTAVGLPADAVQAALKDHVLQLKGAVDDYASAKA